MAKTTEEQATNFVAGVLEHARDWQEGQAALANHETFGPWLEASDDPISKAQDIIRQAEDRLGDRLPY